MSKSNCNSGFNGRPLHHR